MVVAHPRSGSNSLVEILDSHPELTLLNEPFNEKYATWPRDGSWLLASSGSRRMVDPSMVYSVASKRTAGAAFAGLIATILSSGDHTTTWAAAPLHLDERPMHARGDREYPR